MAVINLTSQLCEVLTSISSIQVGNQVYLNTPPNAPRPVMPVAVALNTNQGGPAANAMSPWLQQYLIRGTRPTTGTSPELTRQINMRQQQPVPTTRAHTTTSATATMGHVSILERAQMLRNTGRTVAAQGSNALGHNNPFAINPQMARGAGGTHNNPIVVPSTSQQGGARNHRSNPNNQQTTGARAPQRVPRDDNRSRGGGNRGGQRGGQGSNAHRHRPHAQSHTDGQNRQTYTQQTYTHNNRQQQQRQQSRNANYGRGQTENRYASQHGNPPIWIE